MRHVYVLEELVPYEGRGSAIVNVYSSEEKALKAARKFMKDEEYSKLDKSVYLHKWIGEVDEVFINKQEVK